MASSRAQEIRVGIITILAVAVLVGGIIWGKGGGLSVATRTVQLSFPDASGVEVGTPITLNGVRKGNVTSLEAHPDEVRVVAAVDASFPLQRDAHAFLQMLEVTGGKKIEIEPGDSPEALPGDAVIPGAVQGDIGAMLSNVGEISNSAKVTLLRIDSTVAILNSLIGSRQFREDLENTLSNLQRGSAAANDLITDNRAAIGRAINNLDRASADLRELVSSSRPVVERAMGTVDTISADARAALRKLEGTLEQADTLIGHVDAIALDIRRGNGAVSKLLYDKEFAEELDRTVKSIRELVESIERSGLKTKINIGFGK